MLLFLCGKSYALAVSSLFEVADSNTHSADVMIENNDGKDMFVNISMIGVEYVDGKKIETKLTKDSLLNWSFSVSPTQLILAPGERKSIRMHNNCLSTKCIFDKDQVYAIDINPVPYVNGKKTAVAVSFGYRVYFMDSASDYNIDYKIKRLNDNKFKFDNDSNTMLTAVFNVCDKEFSSDCIYQYRVLSGASKTFFLPKKLIGKKSIKLNIINGNEDFNEQIII